MPTEGFRMQNLFEINSASGNYKVSVGRGVFEDVSSLYPEAIYIVDAKLESSIPSWITRRISITAALRRTVWRRQEFQSHLLILKKCIVISVDSEKIQAHKMVEKEVIQ